MRRTLTGAAGAALLGLLAALLHGQATTGGGGTQPGVTGGAVASVFGRIGSVVGQTGDYSFSLLSGQATAAQVPNLDSLNGSISLAQIPQGGATTGYALCWKSGWTVCTLSDLAGALHLAQLAQDGASSSNVPVWGGSSWAPGSGGGGGGGGGAITSVFGRTGDVVAQSGDYTYANISGTPVFVDQATPTGTVDGSNNVFTLADVPASGSLMLWRNGLLMQNGSGKDYTLSGSTISFTAGNIPTVGSVLLASYRK